MGDPANGERHLVLVGLMGAGKTSVGERCAVLLARPFVDTDDLVEATARLSVAEIFDTLGEAQFRELERATVADMSRVAGSARHRVRWRRGARCAIPQRSAPPASWCGWKHRPRS